MPDKKLNVLLISSWYPARTNPTLGNFVEKHAEAVGLYANVEVLHVCFDPSLKKRKEYLTEKKNGLNIHRIYLRKSTFKIPVITDLLRLSRIIRNYLRGYRMIYKGNKKPDIIHANILIPIGLIAYRFLKKKRLPYIITEHWTGFLKKETASRIRFLPQYRKYAKKASVIAPVTQNLADAMKSLSISGNYSIIPNVVDVNIFEKKTYSSSSIKHILHISTLDDEQKNFSGILKALGKLSEKRDDFILDIISEGNLSQYTASICAAGLETRIKFYGLLDTREVASVMKQSDFLLLFSNYENFPCVIAEAMACGLPVLSTDVGGISEHVNETNGILIKKGDSEALTHQLGIMLENCRNYNTDKIREYAVSNFSYEVIGKKYTQLYQSTLNQN